MAWIESHTVLIRHRKLLQLAIALSLEPVHVMGHLHALWHSALEQQEDGNLSDWPDEMIAQAAHYKGDPTLFVSELQSKKWLNGKIIHDWLDYAGRYLTAKYRNANQRKLKEIYKLHKTALKTGLRRSKGLPKDRPPNLTLPNPPNLTYNLPIPPLDSFQDFWNAYPRKEGKGKCEEWWKRNKPPPPLLAQMLATIEKWKGSSKWKEEGGKYIPMPATWLHQKRWEDELKATEKEFLAGRF